jgi:hypothetical protein
MKLIFLISLAIAANAKASRATADCSSNDGKITANLFMNGLGDVPDFGKIIIDGRKFEMPNTTEINMIGLQRQFQVGPLTIIQYKTTNSGNADGLIVFDSNGIALGQMKCCFDGSEVTVTDGIAHCL